MVMLPTLITYNSNVPPRYPKSAILQLFATLFPRSYLLYPCSYGYLNSHTLAPPLSGQIEDQSSVGATGEKRQPTRTPDSHPHPPNCNQ